MTTPALAAAPGRMGTALALTLALFVAACQGGKTPTPNAGASANSQAGVVLQRVNQAGMNCWFRSKDAEFEALRLIPELDTIYGRPRLLVLKRNSPQNLPVMVIEAHDNPTTIETYGPLAQTALGSRINADIKRWSSSSSQACSA